MHEHEGTAITTRLAKATDAQRCAEIFLASRQAASIGNQQIRSISKIITDPSRTKKSGSPKLPGQFRIRLDLPARELCPQPVHRSPLAAPRRWDRVVGTCLHPSARPARLKCLGFQPKARVRFMNETDGLWKFRRRRRIALTCYTENRQISSFTVSAPAFQCIFRNCPGSRLTVMRYGGTRRGCWGLGSERE